MNKTSRISAIILASAVSACATIRVPLCPAIAEKSYPSEQVGEVVNRYMAERAASKNVAISPLSSFAAEISGSIFAIEWFDRNYPWMMCAFESRHMLLDRQTFMSCMHHASEWMRVVKSDQPEHLMNRETKYEENCVN
ncbi:hypothetical protein [Nitrosospira sp. NpAV]|uniref:hypothetical protein n=1 Tax=Nitrosospira sp. NpAV TaxID=58133 RepID=UPI0005A27D44|nr:hypothetical protein [Nitrosospira sp. NpAV]KIO50269.1 hypothetical protein SQ11_00760 [Nitrosospira sp. NpAV]